MTPTLFRSPARERRWTYRYANPFPCPVELWLSMPRRHPGQYDLRVRFQGAAPAGAYLMTVGGGRQPIAPETIGDVINEPLAAGTINVLVRYRIEPGARVSLDGAYQAEALRLAPENASACLSRLGWEPVPSPATLSEAERLYYLRSTPLVRVDEPTSAEADRLAGTGGARADAASSLERVRRLLQHLVSDRYSYAWPVPIRGSAAMRENPEGDCGSYSSLLAAWCRSLGIPARIVVGTWAQGKMQAHVWNEVFVDGIGWIPVDASAAALLRTDPGRIRPLMDLPRGSPSPFTSEFHLGGLGRDRLAFSLEMDCHPLPGYDEGGDPPGTATRLSYRGGDVAWGHELLEGSAPYLQPAYPRFACATSGATDDEFLGVWRFPRPLSRLLLHAVSALALAAGLVFLVVQPDALNGTLRVRAALLSFAAFSGARFLLGSNPRMNLTLAAVFLIAVVLQVLRGAG